MRLLDKLFSGDHHEDRVKRDKPAPSLVQQIWEAPATFNRATRRAAGLFGRVWKWDVNTPGSGMQRTFAPRYMRRHYQPKAFLAPTTRRQRRHRARIVRTAMRKGL